MISHSIRPTWGRTRIAEADVIRCEAASEWEDVRNDVAPEIRWRRIAVQENNRISVSDINVRHLCVQHWNVLSVRRLFSRNTNVHHDQSPFQKFHTTYRSQKLIL